MTNKTHLVATTALAVAIAAALVAAPEANSAGKKISTTAKATKAKRGAPPDFNKLQAQAPTEFDSFIVSFKKGVKPNLGSLDRQAQTATRAMGVQVASTRTMGTGARVIRTNRVLDSAERKFLEIQLMKNPQVRAVEPNGRLYRMLEPNDPRYPEQWHYQPETGIDATTAWDEATGVGSVIAVLDTGQVDHADLAGQFVDGYDFITDPENARDPDGRDADPNDEGDWTDKYDSSWHGTHVAGTVAALTDNNLGVAGVAFGAKVQHVRVLGQFGGSYEDIADAIVWASGGTVDGIPDNETPADVINMSLGGSGACNAVLQDAIDIAVDNGTVVVASAGNSSSDVSGFQPASCDGAMAIAGTGPSNTPYAATNFGSLIAVAAPAGSGVQPAEDQVLSTLNSGLTVQEDDSYAWYAGTSMAAPHVSGVIAMIKEKDSTLDPAEIREILVNTGYAANGFVDGCDTSDYFCASLINAPLAVAVAAGDEDLPGDPPPPPDPPPPVVDDLENGVTISDIDLALNESKYWKLDVPDDATTITFALTGASPDADLYVQYGEIPTDTVWQCRPYLGSSNETCTFPSTANPGDPEGGEWFVRLDGYTAVTDLTLTGTHNGTVVGGDGPTDLLARHVFALKQHRTRVLLQWEPGEAEEVDIVFDDEVAGTVPNTGNFTHTFRQVGTGTVTYKACNAGSTTECSNEITVNYTSRP